MRCLFFTAKPDKAVTIKTSGTQTIRLEIWLLEIVKLVRLFTVIFFRLCNALVAEGRLSKQLPRGKERRKESERERESAQTKKRKKMG